MPLASARYQRRLLREMVTAAQHYIFEILIEKVPNKCVRPECDQLYDQCHLLRTIIYWSLFQKLLGPLQITCIGVAVVVRAHH